MARDPNRWTVFYDSDCGLCRWTTAQLLTLDRHRLLRPVALQSAEAEQVLHDLPLEQRMASFHLVSPQGRRSSAGAAGAELLRLLPGGRVPAALLASVPALTDRAYRFVADHRTGISRLVPREAKARADRRLNR